MTLQDLAFFAVLGLALYLLMIRPQRNRAKSMAEVRSGLTVGSRVLTTAGIHASVVEVAADRDSVLLEVSPGVPVRFASAAVVRILDPAPGVPDDATDE